MKPTIMNLGILALADHPVTFSFGLIIESSCVFLEKFELMHWPFTGCNVVDSLVFAAFRQQSLI